jgi:type IV secretory pathway TraG/TraD family ATPase VirD4
LTNPTTTQKLIITQNPQSDQQLNTLREMFASPEALGILGSLVGLGIMQILNGNFNSKKKLADARWGGRAEKHKAMLKAFEIMERRPHNESALYLGRPKGKGGDGKVIFLPETERGSIALGGSGTGKTVLFHVPMILSAIDQEYSGIILDIKYPTLTEQFAAYAISNGYKLEIFAPGYPESRVLNFMDFIEKGDPSMAAQFAEVFNLNCKKSDKSKGEDSYFGPIGDQVVQSVLMLCKEATYNGKKYDDLMMAQAILSLPD